MEAALVSAATGALKPVLGKLGTLLGDEYKRFKGVREEIRFLMDELDAMHAFLLKMSEDEDPDVQDKVWAAAVRELSYDMEDSIDDFMQGADQKDAKPDGFIEKIKSSLGKLGKMKTHRRIGNEIQGLKKQLIEVGQRNARYRNREAFSSTKNATVDPRALVVFEHASKLVGIDKPKAELVELLTRDDGIASKQQVKMVSIVGSGGMGKTTLANQVYQDLKGQFKCRAFVSVSRNPDMMKILRTILSEVSGEDYAKTEVGTIQQLISKITNFLAGKRYLIVVDDIWKHETWDVIKCAFPMASCGIIITTTRMKDVANSSRSSFGGHIYNIRPLAMEHSKQLFHGRLFDFEENCPSYLKQVSEQILEKCAGLPLAIIAISGLLDNTEKTEHLWGQVKDSIGCALERNATVQLMMKILSLSYFDLPLHLKTCLLYLSIFPEDSIIEKKDLIRRWIAEGFIHKEGRYTVYESGERCFNELINRSLIQPVKPNDYDKVKSCQVHDTVLDFIISKSIEENFITLVGVPNLHVATQSKARRLSLQVGKQGNSTTPTSLVLSHVRSLNVFGCPMEIPCLDEFRYLRVLAFERCYQLGDHHLVNIGRLFHLRYLNLKHTSVRELPTSIVNLGKLSHLLVGGDVKFPDGIAKMQALEMLEYVGVFRQTSNFLQGLGQLRNLMRLVLDFEPRSATNIVQQGAIASSLHSLGTQNLCFLIIRFGGSSLQHGLLCHKSCTLQKLMVYRTYFPHVPEWIGSFANLQQLHLEVGEVGEESLCILGGLPSLLILHLVGRRPSNGRFTIGGEVGFQCLRQFLFGTQVEYLRFAAGAMPSLEMIRFYFDASDYTSSTRSDDYDVGVEYLPRLATIICEIYEDTLYNLPFEAIEAAMKTAATAHPNRPTLLFKWTGPALTRTIGGLSR